MFVFARTVYVAVLKLFLSGVTHIDNLDVKIEVDAGKRVVAINGDIVVIHFNNGDHQHLAIR